MSLATYDAAAVHALLDYGGCIDAVREAMRAFSREGGEQPLRSITHLGEGKMLGLMPGTFPGGGLFGAKIVSVFEDSRRPGRSRHEGVVALFDGGSGELLCLTDASAITHIRTGCATAVATDALARPDAATLALFGCGAQAESHLRAVARVRPLEEVIVWGRSRDAAERFASRMTDETGLPVRHEGDPANAAGGADIICTVTGSPVPILLREWVRPGTHVNAVGSSYAGPVEVDSALVVESRYIVDSRRSALAAASEFLVARDAGLIGDDHIAGEIGEVLLGRIEGRTDRDQITFYKSLGHIVQDLAAAAYVHLTAQISSRTSA